jgi:5S rRNA maturation endonuclease (ribonuclease M5)
MRKPRSFVWFITVAVVLVATLSMLGSAAAQKASVPRPQDKLALGEDDVKHLLLLMDADNKGMVSKQEFMKYMEAEFERLDKNKIGELNVKELTRSSLSASHYLGK